MNLRLGRPVQLAWDGPSSSYVVNEELDSYGMDEDPNDPDYGEDFEPEEPVLSDIESPSPSKRRKEPPAAPDPETEEQLMKNPA